VNEKEKEKEKERGGEFIAERNKKPRCHLRVQYAEAPDELDK